jgi:uncharacterized membrane protein
VDFIGFDVIFILSHVLVVVSVIALFVILVRFLLAATRAANALTAERTLRVERLRAEDDNDNERPPTGPTPEP